MHRFTAIAAAVVLAAAFSSVGAKADYHYGPVQNGNQCFKASPTSQSFGSWTACPQPASTPVTRTTRHARHQ
jgi:hypothetical protein